jgi:anion-transporting  ArsA/GET3 family ATPase
MGRTDIGKNEYPRGEDMNPSVYALCGPGGVGKTTVSAALAIHLARSGKRTIVLTIDPARRLADSLHIGALSNTPKRVPLDHGILDALMLDPAETFDNFVQKNASNPHAAKELLSNRYYRFASRKMGGVQEYTAMIRLLDLCDCGKYDAIILDTPPARNALEFLQAPQRMAHLMERSALAFFTKPKGGFRAFALGTKVLSRGLKIFLGSEMIDDIRLFFTHFGIIGQAMHEHALRADEILHNTSFYMVSSSEQSVSECTIFQEQLEAEQYPFAGYILNRVPSPYPTPVSNPTEEEQKWIDWITENTSRVQQQFQKQKEVLTRRAKTWSIPEQQQAPNRVSDLILLGKYLPLQKMSTED